MLTRLAIVAAAGAGALIAGYVMWWAAHRTGLFNVLSGVLIGLLAVAVAMLIGLLMVWSTSPLQ